MKEELISFAHAILAKEKGFDWDVLHTYRDGKLDYEDYYDGYIDELYYNANGINRTKFKEIISAPTQAVLLRWLREKHNIDVVISPERYPRGVNYCVQAQKFDFTADPELFLNFVAKGSGWFNDNNEYDSYEKSLEKGLFEGLKLIK